MVTKQQLLYSTYYDKVLAGWIGKSIGGVVGAQVENQKQLLDFTLDNIWPAKMVANDDLDIQVVWLEALQERGTYLTSKDLVEFWQDRCWYNFCEYGYFLHNYQRGIAPPLSGMWNNDFFWESEGCPIRSEIWGFVSPGNAKLAAELARMDGELDHGGVSVQTEMFLAACEAEAFVSDDLNHILEVGLSVIPADSEVARAVTRVRAICEKYPDYRQAWRLVIREYGDRDASKAITNHAIVLMALFLGKFDFKQTMLICTNSGWDTDCTAATAGALLGAIFGTAIMPDDWVEKLGKNLFCGVEVKHKTAPLTEFAEDTCRVGVEMAGTRNSLIQFVESPVIEVRPAPAEPELTFDVEYPDGPVLYAQQVTSVKLIVVNHVDQPRRGKIEIKCPANVVCSTMLDKELKLVGSGRREIIVSLQRQDSSCWLPDKNLFTVCWTEGGREASSQIFGLGGARQWSVYGPYWDMWDRSLTTICPYNNDAIKCNPFDVGFGGDSYNQYVHLDRSYLSEDQLIAGDLPDELPLNLENGIDLITEKDLGGFKGQACYYFVRTFRSDQVVPDVNLILGRSGPYRVWLDGREIGCDYRPRAWACQDKVLPVQITGKPQRLVVKMLRRSDALNFSLAFIWPGDPDRKRGVSYILDCLADQPV